MKFKFKIQDYQTAAVKSVVDIFAGQPYINGVRYTRDLGIRKKKTTEQTSMFNADNELLVAEEIAATYDENTDGFENAKIVLSDEQLLHNLKEVQARNNIKQSDGLVKDIGRCSLDVEMETGTGKTYVYIKTIFELNKQYGFSKFIIVVPSIAIREGVKKTFEITQEHFMEHYNQKARFFIYNSKNLNDLDNFSSNAKINVMIINAQAFNTRGADARRIYEELDEFNSRKPIDVISANRPIIILDEPQKLGGKATQESLQRFNPLFCLNYSATHAKKHNMVYVLDALDAYNERLVKKIEVKGFEVKNLRGTDGYLYVDSIIVSPKKLPRVKLEFEMRLGKGISRKTRIFDVGDNLYAASEELEQYKENYTITEIDPIRGTVTLLNGLTLAKGDVVGDVSEKDLRRVQIRETIISHFEKEEKLFNKGIKTLSLFFIDEVAKYRVYNEAGEEINSEYGQIFEQEYMNVLNDYITLNETPYVQYLKNINVKDTHKGYFSIDKKTNRMVDSSVKRNSTESDDISAYDLILKNKERLLSFDEPTRFIFSHSALREGWDNPNVFQICTLKHSDSVTQKRQEVGRGLRLCVNQNGDRIDATYPGINKANIHDVNKLTVIASESYAQFATDLQKEIKAEIYERPSKATKEFFMGKVIEVAGESIKLDERQANKIHNYLVRHDYIDDDDQITDAYREAVENSTLVPLPEELIPMTEQVHMLVQSIFNDAILESMINDGNKTKVRENPLNDNFKKKEFQQLWNQINHKYSYTVKFESEELIQKAINELNAHLYVSRLQYTVSTGEQKDKLDKDELTRGESFKGAKTSTQTLKHAHGSQIKYDLIGKLSVGTTLTRKTIIAILKGIRPATFELFKYNPEEFISRATKIINEQKATMIVSYITYNQIEGKYDNSIFTVTGSDQDFVKAFKAERHIQDYVFTDGTAEKSVERRFAEALDGADEVSVYAKLPKTFHIPTPVGNYSPDWAIAFKEGSVKHIYFIAETKGTMNSTDIRPIEQAKIDCAKKLFNEISSSKVKYHNVDSYETLLNIMDKL